MQIPMSMSAPTFASLAALAAGSTEALAAVAGSAAGSGFCIGILVISGKKDWQHSFTRPWNRYQKSHLHIVVEKAKHKTI